MTSCWSRSAQSGGSNPGKKSHSWIRGNSLVHYQQSAFESREWLVSLGLRFLAVEVLFKDLSVEWMWKGSLMVFLLARTLDLFQWDSSILNSWHGKARSKRKGESQIAWTTLAPADRIVISSTFREVGSWGKKEVLTKERVPRRRQSNLLTQSFGPPALLSRFGKWRSSSSSEQFTKESSRRKKAF